MRELLKLQIAISSKISEMTQNRKYEKDAGCDKLSIELVVLSNPQIDDKRQHLEICCRD